MNLSKKSCSPSSRPFNILNLPKRIVWQNRSVDWGIIQDMGYYQLKRLRALHLSLNSPRSSILFSGLNSNKTTMKHWIIEPVLLTIAKKTVVGQQSNSLQTVWKEGIQMSLVLLFFSFLALCQSSQHLQDTLLTKLLG